MREGAFSAPVQRLKKPYEEVTGYVYRDVYHALFDDVDKYYTPFITPTQKKKLKTRDQKEKGKEKRISE